MNKNSQNKKDKDFFDYESYIKSQKKETSNDVETKKNNVNENKASKDKRSNKNRQKPPKFVSVVKGNLGADDNLINKTTEKIKLDSHESIESIKKMFDDALDENIADIAEFASGEPIPDMPVTGSSDLKRRLTYVLGIIITVLSIIGLIATVNFSVDKIKAFADNTQQKNDFAKFVYPIVICDPAPFDQTIKLRNETMLTAAMWDIILYEDKSKFTSEFDYIIVPEVEVEKHAIKLFGSGLSFTHMSILNGDVQFYYEQNIKSYRIPSNPKYFTYSPYIENVTRVGERYTVTVGYVSPTPAWLTLNSDEAPTPEKYMEYVVSMRGNEYTLVAIKESSITVVSSHGL